VADELDYLSDELTGNADSAADLAVEITRMNKGIDTLADNFEDWNDILKKSSKGSAEYAKAMSSMKEAVADVLDVEADMLSSDFITKHSDDI
jgi:methyl-accepting chemotaxis protein